MRLPRFIRIYIVPGAVFQSVMIGGGYGTGRELVEYFTRFGSAGGLAGMATATVSLALLLAVTYEYARRFGLYDYRNLFRHLIGPAWVAFEIAFLLLFVVVLGIIGAAAGELFRDQFSLPGALGTGIMLFLVVVMAFFGREWLTRILTLWSFCLYAVVIVFVFTVLAGEAAGVAVSGSSGMVPGWSLGGLKYALYSSAAIPAVLFAARGIETRRQAVVSGVLASLIAMVPAFLFHIAFSTRYPEVLEKSIPTYWMMQELAGGTLVIVYLVILFGTFVETGAGIVQGFIERLDGWARENSGRPLSRFAHTGIALIAMAAAASLSAVGIVHLIARGYGTLAWAFLIVYVIPILTIGIYRLREAGSGQNL